MSTEVTETVDQQERSVAERTAYHAGGKFVTFFLAGEEYGIEILKVQEIIGVMGITAVPRSPEFIRGVINLRGRVIPTLDLRLKFDMPAVEQTEETCIIVVQTAGVVMGIVVDRVSEVLDIIEENIDEAPSFGAEVDTDYILGIGKSGDRIMLLLDIDMVLCERELTAIKEVAASDENTRGSHL